MSNQRDGGGGWRNVESSGECAQKPSRQEGTHVKTWGAVTAGLGWFRKRGGQGTEAGDGGACCGRRPGLVASRGAADAVRRKSLCLLGSRVVPEPKQVTCTSVLCSNIQCLVVVSSIP